MVAIKLIISVYIKVNRLFKNIFYFIARNFCKPFNFMILATFPMEWVYTHLISKWVYTHSIGNVAIISFSQKINILKLLKWKCTFGYNLQHCVVTGSRRMAFFNFDIILTANDVEVSRWIYVRKRDVRVFYESRQGRCYICIWYYRHRVNSSSNASILNDIVHAWLNSTWDRPINKNLDGVQINNSLSLRS